VFYNNHFMMTPNSRLILTETDIEKIIDELIQKIANFVQDWNQIILVGILSAGYPLAQRIAKRIKKKYKVSVPVGKLDVSLYRDDLYEKGNFVTIRESSIPIDISGKEVILVDDVLFSGRTARAAIEGLMDFGRPHKISLAVLIDRGYRELPIKADVVGKELAIEPDEYIKVRFFEIDGEDSVSIYKK